MAARADARAHGTLCKLEQRRKKGFSQSFDGLGVVFFFSFLLMRVRARASVTTIGEVFCENRTFLPRFFFFSSVDGKKRLARVSNCVCTNE